MIKNKGQELISNNKTYDLTLEVNGDIMAFEVISYYSDRDGADLEWKVLSRPRKITDEEVDEIDEFIRDNFIK